MVVNTIGYLDVIAETRLCFVRIQLQVATQSVVHAVPQNGVQKKIPFMVVLAQGSIGNGLESFKDVQTLTIHLGIDTEQKEYLYAMSGVIFLRFVIGHYLKGTMII